MFSIGSKAAAGKFLGVLAVSLLTGLPAEAGTRIVSANPHAPGLPSGSTPPMSGIASLSGIHVNAYHVSNQDEVGYVLGYNAYGKPKILSDDAGNVSVASAKSWITQACNAGEHYEHYDAALSTKARSGTAILSKDDFPAASTQVLKHIKNSSCVSDLAANGTLTVSGRDFYWNGQKVNLVGHSWMGALAGLNFNINGYLSALEFYRVNLTRVWVVEQWTGLAIDGPNAPDLSNVVLPFPGIINFNGSNDTLNLNVVNPAFITRLKQFVQTAAQKGIVVQLTLFDRHGLRNFSDYGRWGGSPYNINNNQNSFFTPGASGKAPAAFLDQCYFTYIQGPDGPRLEPSQNTSNVQLCPEHAEANYNLINTLAVQLGNYHNVIYEIMNEPLTTPTESWSLNDLTGWHGWVAGLLNPSIPNPPPL